MNVKEYMKLLFPNIREYRSNEVTCIRPTTITQPNIRGCLSDLEAPFMSL